MPALPPESTSQQRLFSALAFVPIAVSCVGCFVFVCGGVVSLGIHLIDGNFFSNKLINMYLHVSYFILRRRDGGTFKERAALKNEVSSPGL